MKVSNEKKAVELVSNRACSITAVNSNFTLKVGEKKTSSNKSFTAAASIQANTRFDLESEGFEDISGLMTVSDLKPKKKLTAKILQSDAEVPDNSMQMSIAMHEDEDLVMVEFNDATGEILDWHLPQSYIMPAEVTTMSAVKSLQDSEPQMLKQAVFEVPMHIDYSPEEQAFSAMGISAKSLTKKFKKVFRVFSLKKLKRFVGKQAKKIWLPLVRKIDKKIVRDERLGKLLTKGRPKKLTSSQLKKMQGQKVLLFVHGIISSTTGAFGGIQSSGAFYKELSEHYSGNLIAYDHWTLSKNIFENAASLINQLPKNVELDIVCHSRGAGVTRSLLELPASQKALKAKKIKVRNVCYVAGALQGSDLARGNAVHNLFNVFNKMGVLLGQPMLGRGIIAQVIKLILRGLQNIPGTESMQPEGDFITQLNAAKTTMAKEYHFVRANFAPARMNAAAALDAGIIDRAIFQGKANDVVVPYAGAGRSSKYPKTKVKQKTIRNYGSASKEQSDIWHITFFGNPSVHADIRKSLL